MSSPWLDIHTAAERLGVSRATVYNYVNAAQVRATSDATTRRPALIFRQDVEFVHAFRAKARERAPIPNLISRGVFPPACQNMSGTELTAWAVREGRGDLLGQAPSRTVGYDEMEEVKNQLRDLSRVVEGLVSAVSGEPPWPELTPADCEGLYRTSAAVISHPPQDPDAIQTRLAVYARINQPHLNALRAWAVSHPGAFREMFPDELHTAAPLIHAVLALERSAGQLPTATCEGSRAQRASQFATRVRRNLEAHAHAMLVATAISATPERPLGLCSTDRRILSLMTGSKLI